MTKSLRLTASLALVLTVTLLTSAATCNKPPKTTPGGRVAFEAGRVLEAVKEVQKVVAELEAQKVLTTDQAGTVMIAAFKAGENGEKLADLAQAYDLATGAGNTAEAGKIAPQIDALLTTIGTAFPKLSLGPNGAKVGALVDAVLTAVRNTRAAVTELRNLPPRPQASLAPRFCVA